ncbi:hypothetical protein Tco_1378947 [Tanacetum coccineum]
MDVKTIFFNGDLEEEALNQWHQIFDEVVLSSGFVLNQSDKAVDQLEYSRAIGYLMYAMTSTRPDIAYAVGKLSKYTSTHHWHAKMMVFKYLKKTMDYGLSYVGFPLVLEGYSDASWITNSEDHTSTTALAAVGKETEWLRNLIYEISLWPKPISPISIHCDSATTLAKGVVGFLAVIIITLYDESRNAIDKARFASTKGLFRTPPIQGNDQ